MKNRPLSSGIKIQILHALIEEEFLKSKLKKFNDRRPKTDLTLLILIKIIDIKLKKLRTTVIYLDINMNLSL